VVASRGAGGSSEFTALLPGDYDLAMPTTSRDGRCLACQRGSQDTPLIRLEYLGTAYWICPQHLPVLIHDPARLIGTLPGAERLEAAEHRD
jgi:hypothetical protein